MASDPSALQKSPPSQSVGDSIVRRFLEGGSTLPEDITGAVVPIFLKVTQGSFQEVTSLSEADLVKINLFRKDFEDLYPAKTRNPTEANIWFIVSGDSRRDRQVLAGQFHYFTVDEDSGSTYPIKSSISAWEDLQNNLGFIATKGDVKDGDIVTIRRVYLGYFDPGEPYDFYQPVVVFEGDKNFVAYVPAVSSEYYSSE